MFFLIRIDIQFFPKTEVYVFRTLTYALVITYCKFFLKESWFANFFQEGIFTCYANTVNFFFLEVGLRFFLWAGYLYNYNRYC